MKRTIVFNCLGGPGSGKSTLSYGLTAYMKARDHKAELVTEYAKELTYQRDWKTLENQIAVTNEQDRRLRDLLGNVDFIIHDTALPLAIIYAKNEFGQPWFYRRCWELFDGYENLNCFVRRVKPYQFYGRSQTEEEAKHIDAKIRTLFDGRIRLELPGEEGSVEKAYRELMTYAESL